MFDSDAARRFPEIGRLIIGFFLTLKTLPIQGMHGSLSSEATRAMAMEQVHMPSRRTCFRLRSLLAHLQ